MMPGFSYVRAKSLEDAVRQLASPGARLHAGGTDLISSLRDGIITADKLVSISGLSGLRGIRTMPDGRLRIGALTTVAEIAGDSSIQKGYPALSQAAAAVGSPQLRNQGTIGGNLCQRPRCWYFRGDFKCARKGGDRCYAAEGENQRHCIFGGEVCFMVHPSDTAPALVAIDAVLRIAGPKGRKEVPAEKFFVLPAQDVTRETILEPGEIVAEIALPPPISGVRGGYYKARARAAWDFALVGVASALQLEGDTIKRARLALAGVAPVPWRIPAAEKELLGKKLESSTITRAAAAAVAEAEPLSGNRYKVALLRGAVEEALSILG